MGRIPTATSSDAKASPARSARCHLKTRFGFSPCSIARRATDTPGSQASLANCRRNSRGNSGCLYVNVSSVLLLPEWSPLLIWWGSLWQLPLTPSRRCWGHAYATTPSYRAALARRRGARGTARLRESPGLRPVCRPSVPSDAAASCRLAGASIWYEIRYQVVGASWPVPH